MTRFRDFLYLDDRTVSSLLSGVEGGHYESTDEKWGESRGRDGKAEAKVGPAGGSIGGASSTSAESQRKMLQNAEARFARLWNEIQADEDEDEDEDVLEVNENSPNPWQSASDGRFCKFVGKLSVPATLVMVENSYEYLKLGKALSGLGIFTPEQSTMDMLESLGALRELIKERFPALMQIGLDHPKLILPLEVAHSRVNMDRFTGRATVVGRIVDRIPGNTKRTLLQVPGMAQFGQMSRQQRRQAERKGQEASSDLELDGPALEMRVMAIYQ